MLKVNEIIQIEMYAKFDKFSLKRAGNGGRMIEWQNGGVARICGGIYDGGCGDLRGLRGVVL